MAAPAFSNILDLWAPEPDCADNTERSLGYGRDPAWGPADVPAGARSALASRRSPGAAATSTATAKRCSATVEVPNRTLAHAGVTRVRNMSCAAARRTLRRSGRDASRRPYGDAGARFRLGRWSCVVTAHVEELWKARCARGARAFHVEYGF
jgi:hypothetical protein